MSRGELSLKVSKDSLCSKKMVQGKTAHSFYSWPEMLPIFALTVENLSFYSCADTSRSNAVTYSTVTVELTILCCMLEISSDVLTTKHK